MMNTKIYFDKNNAYNAVIFTQETGFFFMIENEDVDLYAEDAVEQLKALYADRIAAGIMDLSGLCNGDCVFAGSFPDDYPEDEAILLAEYDDEDYAPYVDGLY